jgi:hypothetical protein
MVLKFRKKRRPALRLEKRGERRSFFQRKKDEILLMILSLMIGSVLTIRFQSAPVPVE